MPFHVLSNIGKRFFTASDRAATAESLQINAILDTTQSLAVKSSRAAVPSSCGLYCTRSCQQYALGTIAAVAEAHGSSFAVRKTFSFYSFNAVRVHIWCLNSSSLTSYRPRLDWPVHAHNLQRNGVVRLQSREKRQPNKRRVKKRQK